MDKNRLLKKINESIGDSDDKKELNYSLYMGKDGRIYFLVKGLNSTDRNSLKSYGAKTPPNGNAHYSTTPAESGGFFKTKNIVKSCDYLRSRGYVFPNNNILEIEIQNGELTPPEGRVSSHL